jgi:hypothetical protein
MSAIRLSFCVWTIVFTGILAPCAQAATFVVTRFDDPLPATCTVASCSLREAAEAADANDPFAGTDRIQLAAGNYVLTRGALIRDPDLEIVGAGSAQTHVTTDSDLFSGSVRELMTLRGLSLLTTDTTTALISVGDEGQLILDDVFVPVGGGSVVAFGDDAHLEIRNSELRDQVLCNQSPGSCTIIDSLLIYVNVNPSLTAGADILLQGTTIDGSLDSTSTLSGVVVHHGAVVIEDSVITNADKGLQIVETLSQPMNVRRVRYVDNPSPMFATVAATVQIEDSEFSGNTVRAIRADSGSSWIVRGSTFINNRTSGNTGGAVVVDEGALLDIQNSTFSNNTFTVDAAANGARGAAIGFRSDPANTRLKLLHVTVVAPNILPVGLQGSALGGIGGESGLELTVENTILRGTCALDAGALDAHSGNLESAGNTCGLNTTLNDVSVSAANLAIGTLGDHGGITPTYEPAVDSVAIDADWTALRCASSDQRGYVRPFGGGCDVGAVEVGSGDGSFADGFE